MLQGEHSAILSTFIKLPFIIKIFVLSIFEWPLKTGFTVSLIEHVHKILILISLGSSKGQTSLLSTHLRQMEFPTPNNWTSPFPFEGLLGGVFFVFI